MDGKKKNLILSLVVLLVGFLLIGGTYAALSVTLNTTNDIINGTTTCFNIDYTDNSNQIAGTLFPGSGPNKGLVGSVTINVNSSCSVNGTATLSLHVNDGTDTKFGTTAAAHCENPNTYVTLPSYTASGTCSSNSGTWVTTGTPLKYAIYDNNTFSGNPLAKGYFTNSLIGNTTAVYSNFAINHTAKTLYIYIWLDGYLTDNTYTNLTFDGYFQATATQTEN